jgi:uncharacterized protein involved in high-affinity Fe2+ transport
MRRLSTFIFGMVVGGILIYVALNYHVIQAKDGMHLVAKVDAQLASTYVDIRGFGAGDWLHHPEVAMALVRADRNDLLESAASNSLQAEFERVLRAPKQ